MTISIAEPTDSERGNFLKALYDCFADGAEFEAFLKVLLTEMGLEEVTVTQRTRDGGIDLTARRPGLQELSHVDEIRYVVQAKRFQPQRTVPIEKVRALRGVMHPNDKGLFITTGRFSPGAERFAGEDPTRPVVLIHGDRLVQQCIDSRVGFRFRPVFDREALIMKTRRLPGGGFASPTTSTDASVRTFVKTITANDIRARIISVPADLALLLGPRIRQLKISFPPNFPEQEYNYRTDRRYIAGVTEVFRQFGLLQADGSYRPKLAEWRYDSNTGLTEVHIADEVSEAAPVATVQGRSRNELSSRRSSTALAR